MVDNVLAYIAKVLNHELRLQFNAIDEVEVVQLDEQAISENVASNNRITLSFLGDSQLILKSPFLEKSLVSDMAEYMMISANYNSINYLQALKKLSRVIGILQENSNFTSIQNPDMPDHLEQLTLEMYNVPSERLAKLIGDGRGKYVPSIVYKVGMVPQSKSMFRNEIPGISGMTGSASA